MKTPTTYFSKTTYSDTGIRDLCTWAGIQADQLVYLTPTQNAPISVLLIFIPVSTSQNYAGVEKLTAFVCDHYGRQTCPWYLAQPMSYLFNSFISGTVHAEPRKIYVIALLQCSLHCARNITKSMCTFTTAAHQLFTNQLFTTTGNSTISVSTYWCRLLNKTKWPFALLVLKFYIWLLNLSQALT